MAGALGVALGGRRTYDGVVVEGEAGYYALLPLTIPADVATYPLQIILFGGGTSSATARIDGWPVPLW